MKKRILILMLCLVMLVAFGCDASNEASTNNVENETEAVVSENTEEVAVDEPEEMVYGDYNGYFWEIKNGDAKVYLFGSIHMADESLYPMSEMVEKAFESSDYLGVEADVSNMAAVQSTISLMMYEGDDTVYNHLSEEGIEKFEAICEELKIQPKMLEKFRVWAVGSNLLSLQLLKSPYSANEGVDMYFMDKAKAMDKEIIELEGLEFQINLINSFTDEEQETTFLSGLGTTEETIADFEDMYNKYLDANDDVMTGYLFSEETPAFENNVEDKLLRDRNIGMADKIEEYLKTDKTYFVVVGVAHYLGDESVVRYLEDKGYEVNRK